MSDIQELLDKEARLANRRYYILKQIKAMRGDDPPPCWGTDDCSTEILSRCPWRNDCDSAEAQAFYAKNKTPW